MTQLMYAVTTVIVGAQVRPAPQATIKRETHGQPPAKRDAAIVRSPVLGPTDIATMATLGPRTGLRTMAASRFAGGWP
jgi:hypothetical protein